MIKKQKQKLKLIKIFRNIFFDKVSTLLFVSLILFSLFSTLVFATTVPKGVDGIIYHLDGFTNVQQGVPYIVENLDTGENVTGYTGIGLSGRYSISLNWNLNSHINVTAYNPEHTSSRNITLSGIIHDLDINLNMSIANYAPNITSIPISVAIQEQVYTYQAISFDWNEDEINYLLLDGPTNMTINSSGYLQWTPNSSYLGNVAVSIQASDGILNSSQNFTIKVYSANHAPEITSNYDIIAYAGSTMEYEIDAIDEDFNLANFSIVTGPSTMYVSGNIVYWPVKNTDIGEHNFSVMATDLSGDSDIENFTVNVLPALNQGSSTSSSSKISSNVIEKSKSDNFVKFIGTNELIPENTFLIKKIVLEKNPNNESISIKAKILSFIDKKIALDRYVYKYLEIVSENKLNQEIVFEIEVDKKWANDRGLNGEDLQVYRFVNEWMPLETEYIGQTKDSHIILATTNGFSYFAVSHKINATSTDVSPNIVQLKEPFTFIGRLVNVEKLDSYENINLTFIVQNMPKSAQIRMFPSNELRYQITIQSYKGANVLVLFNGNIVDTVVLNESINTLDIDVVRGRVASKTSNISIITLLIIFCIIIIVFGIYYYLSHIKFKKKNMRRRND